MFTRTAISSAVMFALGCGGGSDATTDASTPDAFVIIDAAFTDIRVRVFEDGEPLANITVVSHDAAGAPVTTAVTDANGEVIVDSNGISIITVLSADALIQPQSFADVSPGDTITVGRSEAALAPPDPTLQDLQITSVAAPNGATTNYIVSNGCNSMASATPIIAATLGSDESCAVSGAVDALIVAEVNNVPVEYAVANDIEVTLSEGTADLSTWDNQFINIDFSFAEIPLADAQQFAISSGLHNNAGAFVFGGTTGQPSVTAGSASFSTKIPPIIGQSFRFGIEIPHMAVGGLAAAQSYVRRDDSPGTGYIINANDLIPGRITALNLDATIPNEPSLSYSSQPSNAPVDAAVCRVNWTDGAGLRHWTMTKTASETGRCTYPSLPANLLDQAPNNQSLFLSATLTLFDNSFLSGYSSILAAGEYVPFLRDESVANSRGTVLLNVPTP